MFLSVDWWSFTDVSRQLISPIFKGKEAKMIIEDGTDTFSRNVGKELPKYAE
jgi:hypothetical protein